MFCITYKTTVKNIIRTPITWLVLAILIIVAIYEATEVSYSYYDVNLNELIYDNDPRYVLTFQKYVQTVMNACVSNIMLYAMPIFTVITTALVLARDYGDKFYEIEKAGGVKAYKYLLGRLTALLSVNFVVVVFAIMLTLYCFVFSRGGVDGMNTIDIVLDSIVRVLRVVAFISIPNILLFIGLTYSIGSIFKNHIIAAVFGLGYAVGFYMVNLLLRFRVAEWYFDFLSPLPQKIRDYLIYFDTELFEYVLEQQNVSLNEAVLSVFSLIMMAFVLFAVAFYRTKTRNT